MDLIIRHNTYPHAKLFLVRYIPCKYFKESNNLPSTNTTGTFGGSNLIWDMFWRGNCPSGGVLVKRNLPSSSLIQKSLSCISKSWDPLFSLSATETNMSSWFLWSCSAELRTYVWCLLRVIKYNLYNINKAINGS